MHDACMHAGEMSIFYMFLFLFFFFTDSEGDTNKYGMVQYMFDGPEMDIKVKPHGNSKTATPFFTTAKKTREHIQELATKSTPKHVVQAVTSEQGGEINAKGAAFLPRNRQQVANFRRAVVKTEDKDILYSIMLECKLAQGKGELFVQDVKAAPEPQSVLFYRWQVDDLVRFCTNNSNFSVLTVDTTFNLGDFFVTPMTYHHLLLENIRTGNHPIMIGPMLVHQRMQFATFNYFASTLIGSNKQIRNVLAFGTDGDKNLTEALGHNFPFALQLRCFIHFKKNVQEKLRDLGLPSHISQQFLDDIFGKRDGNLKIEGLVDSTGVEDFQQKLEALEDHWNTRESPYASSSGPRFYEYFKRVQADVVCYHMRKDIREAAGLGSPPSIFTTNSSEAMNSVLKKQVSYKKTQWPEFVQQMKELVDEQQNEIIRSLSGRGRYRLCEGVKHFGVSVEQWTKMRPEQRQKIVQRFNSATIEGSSASSVHTFSSPSIADEDTASSDQQPSCSVRCLKVSAEESGIHTIPLVTLQQIWSKASSLLQGENTITPVPGTDKRARAVLSYHSDTPHIVRPKGNTHYICDSNCAQWSSSKICSHTVAVANYNDSLPQFLEWYVSSASQPNITTLAMSGMPPGRGRKKNQITRKRVKRHSVSPDTIISSPPSLLCSRNQPRTPLPSTEPSSTLPQASATQGASLTPSHASAQPSMYELSVSQAPSFPPVFLTTAQSGTRPPPPPLVFVGQSNNYSTPPPPQPKSDLPFLSPSIAPPPNTNPFYVKFITGNIRMCQGCRSTLRTADGQIPLAPYDLTIARAERRSFRDPAGNLITPRKETTSHYHCRIECVKAAEPGFIPYSLRIPTDIYSQLSAAHRDYLRGVFGLSV